MAGTGLRRPSAVGLGFSAVLQAGSRPSTPRGRPRGRPAPRAARGARAREGRRRITWHRRCS